MLTFKSKPNPSDIVALVCDVIMLLIFLWNQLRYGMNMLFLIIPLALIGALFAFFVIKPPEYRFTEESLEISRWFLKPVAVSYESVFNYDADARDSFINSGFGGRVKLYYESKGKKAALICRPVDPRGFEDALKARCPGLSDDIPSGRRDVFFKEK